MSTYHAVYIGFYITIRPEEDGITDDEFEAGVRTHNTASNSKLGIGKELIESGYVLTDENDFADIVSEFLGNDMSDPSFVGSITKRDKWDPIREIY